MSDLKRIAQIYTNLSAHFDDFDWENDEIAMDKTTVIAPNYRQTNKHSFDMHVTFANLTKNRTVNIVSRLPRTNSYNPKNLISIY